MHVRNVYVMFLGDKSDELFEVETAKIVEEKITLIQVPVVGPRYIFIS